MMPYEIMNVTLWGYPICGIINPLGGNFCGICNNIPVIKMKATIDFETSTKSYGYTKDPHDNLWYWNYDGQNLIFRDYGYPVNHPFKEKGRIPIGVKKATREYLGL